MPKLSQFHLKITCYTNNQENLSLNKKKQSTDTNTDDTDVKII